MTVISTEKTLNKYQINDVKIKLLCRQYFLFAKLKSLNLLYKVDSHTADHAFPLRLYSNWIFISDQGFGIIAVTNIIYSVIKAQME